MQRYFIYLAYDGAAYNGWQIQPNGITIQATLEKALGTLLRKPCPVVGAGRTDTGVNAHLMTAHFDCDTPIESVELFTERLNRILPKDIAIYKTIPVKNDAHSRFDATSRTYRYYLTSRKDPFNNRYCTRYHGTLDIDLMNEAANRLFDYTDFTSFSKLHTDVKTNNCRIMKAQWSDLGNNDLMFTIQADRFLRNMVRAIVGTLLDVGRGKLTTGDFCRIIEAGNRCKAGTSVPANALFLWDITYPGEIFI